MKPVARILAILVLAGLVPACGPAPAAKSAVAVTGIGFHVVLDGGTATGSSAPGTAFGGIGGILALDAYPGKGGTTLNDTTLPPAFPALTPLPTTGTVIAALSSATLPVTTGNLLLTGTVAATGAGPFTLQCDRGDLLISGDLSVSGGNSLTIKALDGTIYVTGSVRTGGTDGVLDGSPGGALTLQARSVVVLGTLDTRGEDHPSGNGGAGGLLTITTTGDDLLLAGSLKTSGGSGQDGNGGISGGITLNAAVDVHVAGTLNADGGSTTGSADAPVAGDAGSILITTGGSLNLNASISARGGNAVTTGVGATAGKDALFKCAVGGVLTVYGDLTLRKGDAQAGSATPALPIIAGSNTVSPNHQLLAGAIRGGACTVSSRGGDSSDVAGNRGAFGVGADVGDTVFQGDIDLRGGKGGNSVGPQPLLSSNFQFQMASVSGQVSFNGTITARGGDAGAAPGEGAGVIFFTQNNSGGAIFLTAVIDNSGGSSTAPLSTATPGGNGGVFGAESFKGKLFILPGSVIHSDGGNSTGTATAGAATAAYIMTLQYQISISGTLTVRGGTALGPGGTGGAGGQVIINSDYYDDGIGGDITIEAGALIDASGGSGTIGGHCYTTAVSVLGDSINKNLATAGIVINNGTILARGGGPDGNGGNVIFDGLNAGGTAGPDPGIQDRSSPGAGTTGTFTSR